MNSPTSLINIIRRLFQVIGLAIIFLWLNFTLLQGAILRWVLTDISPTTALAESPVVSSSMQLHATGLPALNPVVAAFIDAVPSSDGREVFVSVNGVTQAESPIFLNVDPGIGGGSHIGGYAMTLSDTTYIATATGFAPHQDIGNDGDDTLSITTTVDSQIVSTGDIEFQRAFAALTETERIRVDDDKFILEILNANSFSDDIYILVMATNAAPGPLPTGYHFTSKTYGMRPSHSLTASLKSMVLNLSYATLLPDGVDPHRLAIIRWDALNEQWDVIGGRLLQSQQMMSLGIKDFGVYALATTPIWHDSFTDLTGVEGRTDIAWQPDDSFILGTSAISGTLTSTLIIPPKSATTWQTVHFWVTISDSQTLLLTNSLTLDLLDQNDMVVAAAVGDGADLSHLSTSTYPGLKLRATLTRPSLADESPKLHAWSLGWTEEAEEIFLPFIAKK